ncbi:O-antigen/teichoic acid export membrane protein [Mucilaginibacter frigoritolerans]|uniref:O-antigen/teichoic acid export membrane protein n=1 Tax=Mucilaginibacter frigoritolerans TaxID=652788 RepID=A0A562TYL9_9SPHI|nr:oligosaccharide flippase family protein [Mucilaginibacter frigoritolerans]TWI98711.1 O-antigen/teichoic acid export membrane protein [Mucilaginibacter frigoritolerans]
MKKLLIRNFSVNAIQLVVNQVLGLGIFYVLSTGLDKNSFGQINLALAVLLAGFNILSFGIDQLVIKKIAAGANASVIVSIYIFHVLIAGLVFYGILIAGYFVLPHVNQLYSLLLLIGIGKLMIFFSTPFKQAANGLERFKLMAYMLVISNIIRCGGLIILAISHVLSLHSIVIIFITGDVTELLFCVFAFKLGTQISLSLKWNKRDYRNLLTEALPQTGVVLITSALARFDWIFIGFMVSAVKLAEYSFAYKIYEISTLPLLAIAPLLIPRFTKMVQQQNIRVAELKILVRGEMIIAALVALVLNVCWSPVIDGITAGKYGLINVKTIFILTLCMPFLYLNNFLWTIYFAQGRLKMILSSFIITLLVNVIGDIILIPFFKNEGAAFAFLVSCVVQVVYYLKKNDVAGLNRLWQPLVLCILCALLGGFIAKMLFVNVWLALPAAILIYLIFLVITKQIKLSDRQYIGQFFHQ